MHSSKKSYENFVVSQVLLTFNKKECFISFVSLLRKQIMIVFFIIVLLIIEFMKEIEEMDEQQYLWNM